jgi:undecaprenyl-phosphate galactose phosphotransferase
MIKRFFDLVISLCLLLLLGLPLLLVALIVRIDSRGSVLYRQTRFGRSGKTFQLWKFRTMHTDNEARLAVFLCDYPDCRGEWDEFKKIKSRPDPRVTRVGYWLRRFSIDEFPQIWQVFIGQMSLVGPRPYLIREQEEIRDSAGIIFRVKSGLTGLWQIRGRNELPFRERIRLDEYYVRNWSLSLDMLILLKTFMVVLKGKGAY